MDGRRSEELEELVWSPDHDLEDKVIDQFLVLARSVGTFARAVDEASTLKQPSLHMSAAAASRDITLFHAMELLHNSQYNFTTASLKLVAGGAPKLSCDQMEDWTTAEAGLFEEAMEKYGKGFNEIWTDFLPWKTVKNLVEYYYMWKTTDRYVQQKRVKAVESEQKLKQVYVPDYSKAGESRRFLSPLYSQGYYLFFGTINTYIVRMFHTYTCIFTVDSYIQMYVYLVSYMKMYVLCLVPMPQTNQKKTIIY